MTNAIPSSSATPMLITTSAVVETQNDLDFTGLAIARAGEGARYSSAALPGMPSIWTCTSMRRPGASREL